MMKFFRWGGAGLALLGVVGVSAQDAPVSFRAGVMSSLVMRGLQLSEKGHPVLLASADVYDSSGWSAGASAMPIRSLTGKDAGGWVLRARHDWSLTDLWTTDIEARHDGYVGDAFLESLCYNQLDAGLSYSDLGNASFSWRPGGGPGCPTPPFSKPKFGVDLDARWPLAWGVALDAGAGRLFSGGAASYTYGHWGATAGHGPWTLQFANTWTHGAASEFYDTVGRPHWIASLVRRF